MYIDLYELPFQPAKKRLKVYAVVSTTPQFWKVNKEVVWCNLVRHQVERGFWDEVSGVKDWWDKIDDHTTSPSLSLSPETVGCARGRRQQSRRDRHTPSAATQRNDEALLLSLWQSEVLGNLSGSHLRSTLPFELRWRWGVEAVPKIRDLAERREADEVAVENDYAVQVN